MYDICSWKNSLWPSSDAKQLLIVQGVPDRGATTSSLTSLSISAACSTFPMCLFLLPVHHCLKFFCRVGTILFTALGISVAAIALHGCMRVPDDLFTDEAEVQPLHMHGTASHHFLSGHVKILSLLTSASGPPSFRMSTIHSMQTCMIR